MEIETKARCVLRRERVEVPVGTGQETNEGARTGSDAREMNGQELIRNGGETAGLAGADWMDAGAGISTRQQNGAEIKARDTLAMRLVPGQ